MPTDPARRLVDAMLTVPKFDAYNPGTAMRLARMLQVALDALEEIRDGVEYDGKEPIPPELSQDAQEVLSAINAIAEEE